MTDTVDKVIIQSSSEGTDQATAELQGLAKAYDGVTVASQSTERSTTSVESKFSALERRVGTSTGQMSQFEKGVATVNLALAQNPALQDRAYDALGKLEQRYGGVSQVLQKQRDEMERLASVQRTVNQTTGVVGLSDSSSRAADIAAYGAALDSLRAKYDPLFAAGQKYASVLAEIADAERVGAISAQTAIKARTDQTSSYNTQVANLERVAQVQKQAAQLAVNQQTIVPDRGADIAAYGKQLDDLRAKYNPLFAAGQQYKATLTEINAAAKVGALTEAEAAAAVAATKSAFVDRVNVLRQVKPALDDAVVAEKALAETHSGLSAQGQAAFHSIRSIGEQLASGIPPTQALTGQLNHLTFAATGNGGLSGAFGEVASMLGRLITPATLVIGTVGALAAAAAAAAIQYDKLNVSAQRAISGAGAKTGTTTSDINAFVDKNTPSALSGSTLSQKESRALAEGLTQTGDIVISKLNSMSAAVVGFSNQTGKSMDDSVKAFAAMGSEPVKAMDALAGVFGPFSQSTRTLVQDMVVAGDKTLAWNAILNELGPTAKGTAGNMTAAELATRSMINVLQTAPKPTGLEKQLEDVKKRLDGAIEAAEQFAAHGVAAPPEVSNSVAALSREFEKLYARQQAVNGLKTASNLNDIADRARVVTEELIPQTKQLDDVRQKIEALNRAQAAGQTSKYGASVDNAALTALKNQQQALIESEATAARYNQRVKEIAEAWSGVGQTIALSLQHMQNQLPVSEAWTNAGKMLAQQQATYNDLIDQGATKEEAAAVAAAQYADAKAKAVAGAQQLVQASQDNLDKIQAQGTGMEGIVASTIAYRDAIQAGATATQAAAIAADTLQASMAQAAQAAQQVQARDERAAGEAHGAIYNSSGALVGIKNAWGSDWHDGKTYTSSYDYGGFVLGPLSYGENQQKTGTAQGISEAANKAYIRGGIDAAIMSLNQQAKGNTGIPGLAGANPVPADLNALFSQADALYGMKNAQTSDNATKVSNLQSELAWVQGLPETLARDQKIIDLRKSIQDLQSSVDANTDAQVSLNPLYNGRDALHIGYYKAASGLDVIAQGPTSGDQVPFHAMVNGGERIRIMTAAEQASSSTSNDNRRSTTINISLPPVKKNSERRVQRQYAQGFGQTLAALG